MMLKLETCPGPKRALANLLSLGIWAVNVFATNVAKLPSRAKLLVKQVFIILGKFKERLRPDEADGYDERPSFRWVDSMTPVLVIIEIFIMIHV